ncbi:MAG: dihydrofolate reductase [Candidatus Nanoarchaeia archaeon]
MEKIIIAAMSLNNVIGDDGKIPWKIKEDMKHFRELTTGYPVIMGRSTYDSLGKALPHRENIVVTRSLDSAIWNQRGDAIFCGSIPLAFDLAKSFQVNTNKKAYVIGGGQIYAQTLNLVDRLELTIVNKKVSGDTYFPDINWINWEKVRREDSVNGDYSFVTYKRK